jgi:hypothetical protein
MELYQERPEAVQKEKKAEEGVADSEEPKNLLAKK